MYIGGISLGPRTGLKVIDEPRNWFSAGISMAGKIAKVNFDNDQQVQDVPISFIGLSESKVKSLKSYLIDTVGFNGSVPITPDNGDDLQVGIDTQTPLVFMNFNATRMAFNIWNVDCLFRNYRVPPPIVIYNSIYEQEIITSVV